MSPTLWEYFDDDRDEFGFADWCDRFPNSLNQSRVVLVGYSLGGRLALHLLCNRPALISGAVIISAHTGLSQCEEREARLERDRKWGALANGDWQEFLRRWHAQPVFDETDALSHRGRLSVWKRQIAMGFDAWSLGRQKNLLPSLKNCGVPMHFVTGAQDTKFGAIAKQAVPELPDAFHSVVPNAGHRVPWDQPEAVAEIIRQAAGSWT